MSRTRESALNKQRYILIFTVSIALVVIAVCIYLSQLSATVSTNLMATINEITSHDVETIEGSLDNTYSRLGSVANRMKVYDVGTIHEAQEQMNLEAASSVLFEAIYLLDENGDMYSSSYLVLSADEHKYSEIFADEKNVEHFAMLYDDANGKLETTKESLIYGIRLHDMVIEGHRFVAMLGRSDVSIISDQLLIESFDGQGVSSVVNPQGYYIVSASPATDLTGRNNFYAVLEAGQIENGITIDDVRRNISEGKSFVINCTTADGERLVMSFAPVEGTAWSFIMAVPRHVFEDRFATFFIMTIGMLATVVLVLIAMTVIIYHFIKSSLAASAQAQARSEFLSNMSHEIRTPLNGIIGLNHLMERHIDDRQAIQGYVAKLGKAAQYLLALVNDILDMSKLQAGKIDLEHSPFDFAAVIDNVYEMQREVISERNIVFNLDITSLHYPYLVGDEVRLSQILMNILSNAAKFTPEEGNITFSVHQRLAETADKVTITISIADTGCGMTQAFQRQIFESFSQERNLNSGSQKGTGLGMAISHLLVQEMGGTISVDSELGVGSCFTVTITLPLDPARADEMPCDKVPKLLAQDLSKAPAADTAADAGNGTSAAAPDSAGTPAAASAEPTSRTRVLVAEDNELNAEILSSVLEEEGYEVAVATDGQQAVDLFEKSAEGEFPIILMDVHMPVMDGYEAAREIRRSKRADAASVRIFACTASTFAEDRNRAMESGMDDFLPKPLNMRVMLEKLGEV